MIIYLAGKMTGTPDMGRAQFNEAEKVLTEDGHVVLNPARLPLGLKNDDYMPIGLTMINACEMVVLLPGWEDSPGAMLEYKYAFYQHKHIIQYEDVPKGGGKK